MKILLVQNFYSISISGGTTILCRDLIQSLEKRNHEVLVLCAGPEKKRNKNVAALLRHINPVDDPKELRAIKKRIEWLCVSRRNYFITQRTINLFGPDVVYMHNLEWITNSPLLAAFGTGKRVVLHAHNHLYEELWSAKKHKGKQLSNLFFKTGIPRRNVEIIAISKSIEKGLIQNGSLDKARIHVIYNGIPKAAFSNGDFSMARPLRALYASAISPHKGAHIAIEAVALANKSGFAIELEVAGFPGAPEYVARCKKMAADFNAEVFIKFSGPLSREKVWETLAESKFLLFPSLWEEPFGLIAAEAMARGAVVIGSNRGAIPEVIGNCGKCVEPSAEAFAAAMIEVIKMGKSETMQLRSNAYKRAETMFAMEKNILAIEAVLDGRPYSKISDWRVQ